MPIEIMAYKLFGRTFGVQSLRCGGQLFVKRVSAVRKADAGGAAVALAVLELDYTLLPVF